MQGGFTDFIVNFIVTTKNCRNTSPLNIYKYNESNQRLIGF